MYAAIQYPRVTGRMVVQHGRTLYLPSSRIQINGDGLGGIGDIFKRIGQGALSIATLGMYDLNKNRFYAPFSGGQVRNYMKGFSNVTTMGLVNSDKFFDSRTMRTVGNIGAGIEAAAVAVVGGHALMGAMGSASTVAGGTGSVVGSGSGAVTGATSGAGAVLPSTASNLQAANLAHMTGIPSTAVPSSTGLFATAPITGSYASVPTVANAWGTAGAALTQPSLLSQIGSGLSNFFGKLPSLSQVSQLVQAATPIVKAIAPQQPQEMAPGSGVMVGDPNSMYGGFMPASYGDPSQGLFPGGGVLLPNNYGGGGGSGGVMLPTGGGPEGEQLTADGGGLMNHPAVPYIAVVMILGAAYFIMKKK